MYAMGCSVLGEKDPAQFAEAVNIASQDDRHIAGTLSGSGRLKLKGRAEIRLNRNSGPGGPR